MRARGLIIAAPASGSGKTLVTAGLLRHLRRRGIRVAGAKAGPDFIDPSFHLLATGRPCVNLDPWSMRPATLAACVAELDAAADLILCEGVMGLFDGTGADGETGSTAELAALTGWPVVLVVDARGQGASIAALLRGFIEHRADISVVAVIFNRIASERHRAVLAAAVAHHLSELRVLGALPVDADLTLLSRHLGLVPAEESETTERVIACAADQIVKWVDVDGLLKLTRPARIVGKVDRRCPIPPLGRHIAVARDNAFRFAYPTVLDGWQRAGAHISFFSPLADEAPTPIAEAIYLPGGYPELWAGRLAAAERFVRGLREAAAQKKPIYGECGGYMVLGAGLTDSDGRGHRMAGLLPLETSFAVRHLQLGYRAARLIEDSPLGPGGSEFRGHEFHFATIVKEAGAEPLWRASDAADVALGPCGLRRGSVFGSFIHLIDRTDLET